MRLLWHGRMWQKVLWCVCGEGQELHVVVVWSQCVNWAAGTTGSVCAVGTQVSFPWSKLHRCRRVHTAAWWGVYHHRLGWWVVVTSFAWEYGNQNSYHRATFTGTIPIVHGTAIHRSLSQQLISVFSRTPFKVRQAGQEGCHMVAPACNVGPKCRWQPECPWAVAPRRFCMPREREGRGRGGEVEAGREGRGG